MAWLFRKIVQGCASVVVSEPDAGKRLRPVQRQTARLGMGWVGQYDGKENSRCAGVRRVPSATTGSGQSRWSRGTSKIESRDEAEEEEGKRLSGCEESWNEQRASFSVLCAHGSYAQFTVDPTKTGEKQAPPARQATNCGKDRGAQHNSLASRTANRRTTFCTEECWRLAEEEALVARTSKAQAPLSCSPTDLVVSPQ